MGIQAILSCSGEEKLKKGIIPVKETGCKRKHPGNLMSKKKNPDAANVSVAIHKDCFKATIYPLGEFCREEHAIILDGRQLYQFEKDDILFREHETANGVFCLGSGRAKLIKRGHDGRDHIVRLAKPGDVLGITLFTSPTYTTSAVALDEVQACYISKINFLQIFAAHPRFAMNLMRSVARDIGEVERRIAGVCQKTARQRVAEILLMLLNRYGIDQYQYLDIPLPLKDLANFSCTSCATLSRLLSDFKKRDLIRVKRHKIKLVQLDRLIQIAKLPAN